MFWRNHIVLVITLLALVLGGCKGYNYVLKNGKVDEQYKLANEYYAKKKYSRALPLLEVLIPQKKLTGEAEDVFLKFCYSHYYTEDYESANFYFELFGKTFPQSNKLEETEFMLAYCAYLSSPEVPLDPTNTYRAIGQLQLFTDKHPTSLRVDSCNKLIDELRLKLEDKSFAAAQLYNKTRQWKSAIVAYKATMKDFPTTRYYQDCLYHIANAAYSYAEESIDSRKYERYKEAYDTAMAYKDRFPAGKFINEMNSLATEAKKLMDKYKPFSTNS